MRYPPFSSFMCAEQLGRALAAGVLVAGAGSVHAADQSAPTLEEMANRLKDLEKKNEALSAEVTQLRMSDEQAWLTEQRALEIRGIVTETLADAESRSSLQSSGMTAGWDNGFFLQSPDGRFRLEVGGLLQTRFIYSYMRTTSPFVGVPGTLNGSLWMDDRQTRSGFDIPNAQITFQGHLFGAGLTYKLRGAFENVREMPVSGYNTRPLEQGGGAFVLQDAWTRMEITPNLFFRAGQFKLPFAREELIDTQYQLAVAQSLVVSSLGVGYSQGIELAWVDDLWRVQAAYSDGGNDNVGGQYKVAGTLPQNQPFDWSQVEWALTGRVEFKPYGDWSDFDAFTSVPGSEFGMMFGFGAHWQSWRPEYGYTLTGVNQGDNEWTMLTTDASINFGGASLFGSFTWSYNHSEAAYYYGGNLFNVPIYAKAGVSNKWGLVLQGAFYVAPKWELFGRYELGQFSVANPNGLPINAGGASAFNAENHLNLATVGVNWYIDGQDAKFTFDTGYSFDTLEPSWFDAQSGWRVSGSRDEWVTRMQFQIGF